jgi:putative ABC transport system permease protein
MITLKTYIRHLLKNKLYTLVTVLGFALSLMFVLLLSVYIQNELSVNDFQKNKNRIYRIENEEPDFSGPIAVSLKNSIPDIEDFTRIYDDQGVATTTTQQKVKIKYLAVDNSFFNIFSYPLVYGNPSEVLATKNSMVLSKTYAFKLFGNENPIGKKVTINANNEFMVTGIVEDFPEKTHFKSPDALINIQAMADITGYENFLKDIGFCSMSIYFLETNNGNLPAKAPQILANFKKDFWLYKEGYAKTLVFTPLKEIYFSDKIGKNTKGNSKTLIIILSVIVLLILLLAVGNYINLTIAQATFRGKEVAIKKLVGSSKKRLFGQFIKESVMLCLLAAVLSLFLAKLAEPIFNTLLDTQLNLNSKITFINLLIFIGGFGFIGVLSGIIPAIKITNFKPIEVVKGSFRRKSKGVYGKAFITFQYTVAITLLACSWLILKQTRFLKNYPLGFNKKNIVYTEYLGGTKKKATIKNALLQIPGVEEVSLTWGSPLDGGSNMSFDYKGKPVSFQEFAVDSSFFNVFGIKIKPTKTAYSKEGIYLNKTALKVLEFQSIPPTVKISDGEFPILGVVNDFHFNSLRKKIGPIYIRQQLKNSFATNIFLKVNSANLVETLGKIKATYTDLIDGAPFEITFVDDAINQWYLKEEKAGKIIGYFTILSFIISFMGILAMSTFYMQQRTKEIGIRKVNGASIAQILSLLSKNFLKWIGLAFVIAVPISWYAIGRWLENFSYKTPMSWWIFALAGITAFGIALLTISWQSIKAARRNPVEVLRDE